MDPWPTSSLEAAERTFRLLAGLPRPPMVEGRNLLELRDYLLDPATSLEVRDAVWRQLVDRHRELRGEWSVAAVGMAMPGLVWHARQLGAGWRDVEDLHAELVLGFLRELERVDVDRPRIVQRLLWAARRAGLRLRTAQVPQPVGERAETLAATDTDADEPDADLPLLLSEARERRVITSADVELITATRLGRLTMGQFARRRGLRLEAVRARRSRAERRLAAAVRHGVL